MEPGTIFAERYEIETLAGSGGMGSVFRARDPDGQPVALKVLRSSVTSVDRRFQREARLLCSLRHPTIVRYLDSGTTPGGEHFLAMEWLDGEDLRERLGRERLFLGDTLTVLLRVAKALGVAHSRGVVHRDVKPANIFLPGGRVSEAKLLDFGLARWVHAPQGITSAGTRFGTPAYMSPEHVRGTRDVSAASDVFSLGCVLFECLAGEPAFAGRDPMAVFCKILFEDGPYVRDVAPWVPQEIEDLLQRMLAKDVDERLRNGNEVAAAIEQLAQRFPDIELGAAHPAGPRRAITESEQRWAHVVVAAVGQTPVQPASLPTTVPLMPRKAPGDAGGVIDPDGSTEGFAEHIADTASASGSRGADARGQLSGLRARVRELGARAGVLGDGTLVAVFDTPEITSRSTAIDQAVQAARCALLVHQELPGVPVALATGRATTGQARLLGEVIERAVTLLGAGADSPGVIHVDETSRKLLAARFEFSARGGAAVLERERSGDSELTLLGRPIPFVGRKREMSLLVATLEECVGEGLACAVQITGPPGVGKSRLRQEFTRHVARHHPDVALWLARGEPMRAGTSLGMMVEFIRGWAGIVPSEPAPDRRAKLRARVAEHVPARHVDRVTRFVAELLKIPPTEPDDVQLRAARADRLLMGAQIQRACKDLVEAELQAHPVVLLLEDLHWGDRATVAMIDKLLRNAGERSLMVVGIARPEVHENFPQLWSEHNATELRLGRLPRRASQRLVRAMLGPDGDTERVRAIVEHGDGNAFYLRELARSAAGGRRDLPDTVLAMVQARLGALDPQARQILRAASIFGRRFWRGGVVAVVGDHMPVDDWLYQLVDEEFIGVAKASKFPGESEYIFRHELIREGAYAMLPDSDRELGHRLAGEWLERMGEGDEQVIAEQFDRGGAPDRALPHYVRAAESALDRSDFQAASELAERGERCGARGEMLGALRRVQIEVNIWRQSTAEAARLSAEALSLLPRGSRAWYDVLGEAALAWSRLGESARVEDLAGELLGSQGDRLGRSIAMTKLAAHFFFSGHVDRANALMAELEAEVGDLDRAEPTVAANTHFARALRASIALKDQAALLEELERCARRFEEIGDLRQAYLHRANAGYAKAELGLYSEAEADLRAVVEGAERTANELVASTALQTLAVVLGRRGALDEAVALARRAVSRFEGQDARMAGWAKIDLATVLLWTGDAGAAERESRAALELLPERALLRPMALATLARVLFTRGQTEPAVAAAAQGMDLLDTLGTVESGESLVRLVYAEAMDAKGDGERARAAIASARDSLLARARRISRGDWRRHFLHDVAEHARTLELAEAWLGDGARDQHRPR